MKILYHVSTFSGGAPLSLLEYIKLAKKNRYEVLVVGEKSTSSTKYDKNNIRIINKSPFNINNPLQNIRGLYHYIKIIQQEKPDLIHAIKSNNCIFHKVVHKFTQIPILYSQAGGEIEYIFARQLINEPILVFSEENKKDLQQYGKDPTTIYVISNRMNFDVRVGCEGFYKTVDRDSEIKLLLISRLVDNKINSIYHVMRIAQRLIYDKYLVTLTILGDGEYLDSVKTMAHKMNQDCGLKFITVVGYTPHVNQYIQEAHVVFGKGRSVLEAVFHHKISFVISEEKTMGLCTEETVGDMSIYNFSGRFLSRITSYEELQSILNSVYNGSLDINYLLDTKREVEKLYDIKYAEDKIISLYLKVIEENQKNRKAPFLIRLFKSSISYMNIYYFALLKRINSYKRREVS